MWTPNGNLGKKNNFSSGRASGKSNFNNTPEPRLVEILEVHPATNGEGFLIVKDLRNDKKYNVVVSDESFRSNKEYESRKTEKVEVPYQKWLIDERMEKAIQGIKHKKAILTKTNFREGKLPQEVDGEKIYFIETNEVRLPKKYSPAKTFYKIVTASTFHPFTDRAVGYFQAWEDQAIEIDFSDDCMAKLDSVCDQFDEIAQKRKEIEIMKEQNPDQYFDYPVAKGFQIRALKVSEKPDGEKQYTLIESYEPLSLCFATQDADGNITEKARPINSEWFSNFVFDFAGYVFPHYTEQDPSTYNIDFDNLKETVLPKDVIVEVMIYDEYLASKLNKENHINNPESNAKFPTPLERMVQKRTKSAQDVPEQDYYLGKNLATYGIVELASNKIDEETNAIIENNFVKRVTVTGRKLSVHSLVKTGRGGRVIIPDSLKTREELEQKLSFQNNSMNEQLIGNSIEEFSDDSI